MRNLLQHIGLRSNCCNAKLVAWHYNRHYCVSCGNWDKLEVKPATAVKDTRRPNIRTRVAH